MKKYLFIILTIILTAPNFIYAGFFSFSNRSYSSPNNLQDIVFIFLDIISLLIPLAVALAVLFFFWGLAKFILNSGNEEKKSEGKEVMLWGIVALFVMVTIGGIVAMLNDTFLGGWGNLPLFY